MNKRTITGRLLGAAMGILAMAGTAHAGDAQGKWQIKLLATGVLPDGKVSEVKNDAAHLISSGAVTNTEASNNVVPTMAVEYFLTPRISVETICCVTGHHVTVSAGSAAGVVAVDNVQVIPATLTAKYRLPLGAISPYLGAGPAVFIMLNDRPSATMQSLGVTRTKMSSNLGVAVQAGVDVAIGHGYSISLDAKKYWVSTDATFYTASGVALETRHKLDPWLVSGGLAYRF